MFDMSAFRAGRVFGLPVIPPPFPHLACKLSPSALCETSSIYLLLMVNVIAARMAIYNCVAVARHTWHPSRRLMLGHTTEAARGLPPSYRPLLRSAKAPLRARVVVPGGVQITETYTDIYDRKISMRVRTKTGPAKHRHVVQSFPTSKPPGKSARKKATPLYYYLAVTFDCLVIGFRLYIYFFTWY